MARRISILAFLVAVTIVTSFSCQDVRAQKTITATSVTDLNAILALQTPDDRLLEVGDTVIFTQNAVGPLRSPYIVLQDEIMSGTGNNLAYNLRIEKTGAGVWRLGPSENGPNATNLTANTSNFFSVQGGTLELMNGSTVTLASTNVAAGGGARFSLGAGTTLNLRGSNSITATNIEVQNNVTFGFDLSNDRSGTPMLTLNGIVGELVGTGSLNLLSFKNQTAAVPVTLMQYRYAGDFTQDPNELIPGTPYTPPPIRAVNYGAHQANFDLLVRGEKWQDVVATGRVKGQITSTLMENIATDGIAITIADFSSAIGSVTWTGTSGNGLWNATSHNWTGTINGTSYNTFLHGDAVLFNGAGSTITVQAGGVQIGETYIVDNKTLYAAGMTVERGVYTFQNAIGSGTTPSTIGIDGPGKVWITAPKLTNGYDRYNAAQVTFSSANSYWGGTLVDNEAKLTLENTGAVGTGALTLDTGATLTFDIKKTDPTIPDDQFKQVFYNDLYTAKGTKVIKKDIYDLTLEGSATSSVDANQADTFVENGILRKNISSGVLSVNLGATYTTLGYYEIASNFAPGTPNYINAPVKRRQGHDRTIAGLIDGDDGGGTVDMDAFRLTIDTSMLGNEYVFSGLITGVGAIVYQNEVVSSGGSVEKRGIGTQIFANDQNTYPDGTMVREGTLVGSYVLTKNLSDYRPFGDGDIVVKPDALLAFELTGPTPETEPTYAAILHNAILCDPRGFNEGSGDVQVGFDRRYSTGAPDGGAQILHLFSDQSNYTGRTFVNKGKLRVSNVKSTGRTSQVRLLSDTALQFVDMKDSSISNPYDRLIYGEGGVEVLRNDPETLSMTDTFGPTIVYLRSYNSDMSIYSSDGTLIEEKLTPEDERSNYTGVTFVQNGTTQDHTELHLLDVKATGNTEAVVLEGPNSTLFLDFLSITDENGVEQEQVYNRTITGDGNLVKDHEGIAVLRENGVTHKNDYKGKTLVKQGTLKLEYAEATGAGHSDLSGAGGPVSITKDAILELAFDGIYEKHIDGQGILAKSGAGTVTILGGISTYTGGTEIYGGTLSYYDLDPNVVGNLGIGGVTFKNGGGTLQNRGVVAEFEQRILIHAGSTATFDTQRDLTVTGDYGISHVDENDTGEASHLVKKGEATMTINTKVVTWTGETIVEKGVLKNNIPEYTGLTVFDGAEYHTGSANRIVSALLGDGVVQTSVGYGFTVDNIGTCVFGGRIIGDGNLIKDGDGTLELSGYSFYTGSTSVNDGILIGGIAPGTDLTVQGSGEYRAGNGNRFVGSLQGSGLIDMEKHSLTINQTRFGFMPEFKGNIKNGDWLTKTGEGTQILSGREYGFSGNVEIQEGILQIGGANTQTFFNTTADLAIRTNGELSLASRGKINIGKTFNIQGTLSLNLGSGLITATDVVIGPEAALNVFGISGTATETVVIHSTNVIQGDFDPGRVTVAGESSGVDFMEIGAVKSDDGKEILIGQSFSWYHDKNAHGNFTLSNADSVFTVGISLNDVTGTFDPTVWDGKTLTKRGPGTLILSAVNNYTGATNVEGGTLKLTNEQATLGSKEINLSVASRLELDFNSIDAQGKRTKGLTTSIVGEGDVYKTGADSIAVLGGAHSFTGQTFIDGGVLLLNGTSPSRTWVRNGAGFGGNGTLNAKLTLEDGSRYYWYFDGTAKGSDRLTVNSSVHIGDGVAFCPVATVTQDKLGTFSNLTVVSAMSGVYGQFAGVDAGANPFYIYQLDYSDSRKVKISGFLRDEPLPLSDIVAASLTSAQTRMYRTAYQQIQREWMSECPHHGFARSGLSAKTQRRAWMNFVGRGGDLASSYFNDDYSFQSYGVQAGLSLVSDCTRSAGILFGREENKLSNRSDEVKGEDYYLGFYYGQVFSNGYDMKGYIGGGWQKNRLIRTSNSYRYGTSYNGNTYNTNIEFGRRFLGKRNWLIRPFVGADLNVTWIGSSLEKSMDLENSNEYRGYRKSDLAQFYLRAGIEATQSWRCIDFRMGTQFRWNVGDSKASTGIYYPSLDDTDAKSSVLGYSSDLGRLEWGFNFGLNWFLNEQRSTLFFIDYDGDLYGDRPGDPLHGTGTLGFVWGF